LLLLAFFLGNAFPGENLETEERIRKLEEKLRCLVCQNQTLADSNAELAGDLRAQVREQVKAGKNDEQVVDYLVARYGDFVRYDPPFKASTALLWVGPFVLLAVGAGVLVAILRRRRGAPEAAALGAEERRLVEKVLGPGEPQ
jgi:cytochrome c-type biogenesis protein CcmH